MIILAPRLHLHRHSPEFQATGLHLEVPHSCPLHSREPFTHQNQVPGPPLHCSYSQGTCATNSWYLAESTCLGSPACALDFCEDQTGWSGLYSDSTCVRPLNPKRPCTEQPVPLHSFLEGRMTHALLRSKSWDVCDS